MCGSAGKWSSGACLAFGRSLASSSAVVWFRARYASMGNSGARTSAHSKGSYSDRPRAADLAEALGLTALGPAPAGPRSGEEKGAVPRRLHGIRRRQEGEEDPGGTIEQPGVVDPGTAGLPVSVA